MVEQGSWIEYTYQLLQTLAFIGGILGGIPFIASKIWGYTKRPKIQVLSGFLNRDYVESSASTHRGTTVSLPGYKRTVFSWVLYNGKRLLLEKDALDIVTLITVFDEYNQKQYLTAELERLPLLAIGDRKKQEYIIEDDLIPFGRYTITILIHSEGKKVTRYRRTIELGQDEVSHSF